MKNIMKSLALILAIVLAMTLSLSVLAEGESSDVSTESVVESSDVSGEDTSSEEASSEATSSEEASSEATSSEAASSETASSEATSSEATSGNINAGDTSEQTEETVSNFPWARVITLIVIVVLVLVAWILTKTNTALGQKIKKFCKEYWSEIKKVSWLSPKDTAKQTGIVLVFLIVAAVAIALLDLGFTKLIENIANIFNK